MQRVSLPQQRLQQQSEKQKEKKADPSVNRQQSLMASWLRRPIPSPTGGRLAGTPAAGSCRGSQESGPSAAAAEGDSKNEGVVVVLDEEEQAVLQSKRELRRAAEAEATAWKATAEDREGFIELIEDLARCKP